MTSSSGEFPSTPVTRALDELGLPYRLFMHERPPRSVEAAAAERNQKPEQVVRSLLFRLSEGEFIMVLVAGPDQVDWALLRHYVGQSRLTTASREEVLEATGYPLGAVAPLGLPQPLRIIVDRSLLSQEEISLGSGVRGLAVIMQARDLLQAIEPVEFADLVK